MSIKHIDPNQELDLQTLEFESNRLWQYFEYHAKQRIETFRFYVIFAGIIISGAITLLTSFKFKMLDSCSYPTKEIMIDSYLLSCIALGFLLIIFSMVFCCLDNRNKSMVYEARDEIIKLENSTLIENKIFTNIKKLTDKNKPCTFSFCFDTIFWLAIILGLIIIIYSVAFLMQYSV